MSNRSVCSCKLSAFQNVSYFFITLPISLILGYGESNFRCCFISLLVLYFVGLIYCDNSCRMYTASPYATEQFVSTRGRQGLKRYFFGLLQKKNRPVVFDF